MMISRLTRSQTFAGILLLGLLAMTARNALDPDLWWHLRTGQWILETRSVPHTDPFSFTRAGSPWVSHEWLAEVTFFALWKVFGAGGLIIFSALITTAGFMLLHLRCRGAPLWVAIAMALAALAAAPSWGVRPQMFTFTLASLLLWLLERSEEKPHLLLCVPVMFLLWINLHAGFAFAPALLTSYGVGIAWEAATGALPWRAAKRQLFHLGWTLLACLVLVPLNPSGALLYRYPLDVVRSTGMRSFINEWFPPDFHQLHYLPLFLMWVAAGWALTRSSNPPRARTLFPLLLTFLAALDAVRHIPLFTLLAAPVIATASSGVAVWRKSISEFARPSSAWIRTVFRFAVLLLLAGFTIVRWAELIRTQAEREAEHFPVRAVEFLQAGSVHGNLFAYYDWGGYALWKLYPRYRVFIDGRADLYGEDLLHKFQQVTRLETGWQEVLDTNGVHSVLVPSGIALAQALLLNPRWQVQYSDSQAILFVRVSSPGWRRVCRVPS